MDFVEEKKKDFACGILPYKGEGENIQFLIGRMPQGSNALNTGNSDAAKWDLFKGKMDEGETEQEAAKREFEEESSFKFKGSLDNAMVLTHKKLKIWLVEMPQLDAGQFDVSKVSKITGDYLKGRPEIEGIGWFGPDEAENKLNGKQKPFIGLAMEKLEAPITEVALGMGEGGLKELGDITFKIEEHRSGYSINIKDPSGDNSGQFELDPQKIGCGYYVTHSQTANPLKTKIGPFAYDLLIELGTLLGGRVMSSGSPSGLDDDEDGEGTTALPVWLHYNEKRSDLNKEPFDFKKCGLDKPIHLQDIFKPHPDYPAEVAGYIFPDSFEYKPKGHRAKKQIPPEQVNPQLQRAINAVNQTYTKPPVYLKQLASMGKLEASPEILNMIGGKKEKPWYKKWFSEQKDNPSQRITKLRIFDFDETIAFTRAAVHIETPDGKEKSIGNQKWFDAYVKKRAKENDITAFDPIPELEKIGFKFDFSDFAQVKDPKLNNLVVTELKRIVYKNRTEPTRGVYVMTARGPAAKQPIFDYLMSLEEDGSPLFQESDFTEILTVSGGSKKAAIEELLAKHSFKGGTTVTEIAFWDDSQRNVGDVLELRKLYPDMKIDVNHVKHGKVVRLEEETLFKKELKENKMKIRIVENKMVVVESEGEALAKKLLANFEDFVDQNAEKIKAQATGQDEEEEIEEAVVVGGIYVSLALAKVLLPFILSMISTLAIGGALAAFANNIRKKFTGTDSPALQKFGGAMEATAKFLSTGGLADGARFIINKVAVDPGTKQKWLDRVALTEKVLVLAIIIYSLHSEIYKAAEAVGGPAELIQELSSKAGLQDPESQKALTELFTGSVDVVDTAGQATKTTLNGTRYWTLLKGQIRRAWG